MVTSAPSYGIMAHHTVTQALSIPSNKLLRYKPLRPPHGHLLASPVLVNGERGPQVIISQLPHVQLDAAVVVWPHHDRVETLVCPVHVVGDRGMRAGIALHQHHAESGGSVWNGKPNKG